MVDSLWSVVGEAVVSGQYCERLPGGHSGQAQTFDAGGVDVGQGHVVLCGGLGDGLAVLFGVEHDRSFLQWWASPSVLALLTDGAARGLTPGPLAGTGHLGAGRWRGAKVAHGGRERLVAVGRSGLLTSGHDGLLSVIRTDRPFYGSPWDRCAVPHPSVSSDRRRRR